MYDLKIVGGTLVDGTGKDRYSGDLGIKGGRIVAVGDCDGAAAETIDATGAIVAPGFVDIHTHYDGQISWDEELAPSSIHGVTTSFGLLAGRPRHHVAGVIGARRLPIDPAMRPPVDIKRKNPRLATPGAVTRGGEWVCQVHDPNILLCDPR